MTGPAIVNILAAMPVTKPSALNSIAGETDKLYHFDNDGKLSKGLFSDDSGLYYIDKNGAQKDKRDGRGRARRVLVEAQLSPAV